MARPAARAAARNGRSRPAAARTTKKATGRTRTPARQAPVEKKRPAPPPPAELRRAVAPQPSAGETRSKYVYCVIESEKSQRFGPLGLGAEPSEVTTVHFRNLAAVVSDTPREVIDATRENILAHERVNEAVMRNHTVIPMSFGTVFKTREDIVELLRAANEAFTDVLQKMRDKLEFGLKVLWDRDQIVREIEKDDENVRRLKDEISSQSGSTYFARMQYGRMVDTALEVTAERYVTAIFEALRPVSTASRANKPIGEKMIMNAAFLVTRDQENAFDSRVKEIGARFDTLTLKYTGPWPPYNFVNIRLKLERAQGSE
jgi:Gas vesicle synthesis protein GvpL/GvpF